MTTSARSVSFLVALAFLGCSAVVDPESYDPVASAEGFCNSIQDALADLPCGTAEAALEQQFAYLRTGCDTLQAAVDDGKFRYDSGAAAACIDEIERLGCRGTFGGGAAMAGFAWPQPCRDALRGRVAAGGACSYDEWSGARQAIGQYSLSECVDGAGCYASPAGDGVCGDTCEFPAGYLGSCSGGRPCQEGFICAANLDYKCHYGTTGDDCNYTWTDCAPGYYCTPSPGGTCQVAAPSGAPCSDGSYCRVGSYCSGGVCVAKVGVGASCGTSQCQDGLTCYYSSVASTWTCAYPAQAGGSCAATNCDGQAQPSLYCDAAQICRTYPAEPLPRGASCWGLGTGYCADGLFCDTSGLFGGTNLCQPQLGPGGDCSGDMGYELCRPGTYCDTITYTCVGVTGLDGTCNTMAMNPCQAGLYCKTPSTISTVGVCSTPPTDGEACPTGGPMMMGCAPGHHQDWSTGPCTCRRNLGLGDPCTSDEQCGYGTGLWCDIGSFTCQIRYACEVPIGWYAFGGPI